MRRRTVLVGGCVLLVVAVLASLAIGSNPVSPTSVWRALWAPDGGAASTIVWDLRMPRTLLGLVVGAALATSGVLLQALTRNPLAEPRVLGISAGAALGVVAAITLLNIGTLAGYVWFGIAGAALDASLGAVTEEQRTQVTGGNLWKALSAVKAGKVYPVTDETWMTGTASPPRTGSWTTWTSTWRRVAT